MAGAKEIRSKIKSIQNTAKITKAMEMVAASKMRKAQDRMRASRPYAEKIRNVLAHLAQANPELELAPTDPFAFAQAQALNGYIASTLHVAFAHKARAARWADEPAAIAAMQAKVATNIAEGASFVEEHLLKGAWALGARYSMCDPYLFLVHRWMVASGVDLADYPKLSAHTDAMRARPAVQAALAQHRL